MGVRCTLSRVGTRVANPQRLCSPARVSSSCDDLLDQLNDLSFLGDIEHKDRVTHLRHSLMNLNRGQVRIMMRLEPQPSSRPQRVLCKQGLGFLTFGTVIDKRMLVKVGMGLSGLGTLASKLVSLGEDEALLTAAATNSTA